MFIIFTGPVALFLADVFFLGLYNLLYNLVWGFERHGISATQVLWQHAKITAACQVVFVALVLVAEVTVGLGTGQDITALHVLFLTSIVIPLLLMFLKHRQLSTNH